MTIYSELLRFGYTDDQIKEAVNRHLDTRCFGLSYNETPDGWPIIGVKYQCDFRSEEETGVGAMAKNFAEKGDQTKICFDTPEGGFVFVASDYVYDVNREILAGRAYWQSQLGYAQGGETLNTYRMTVKELKEWARDNNLSLKGLTKRDQIEPRVRLHSVKHSEKSKPNQWPGWFHNGNVMYLKAEGIVYDVLRLIWMAGGTGDIGVLNGSSGFGSGFGFFDKADIGPKLQAEIDQADKDYKEAMKALEPVKKELEAKGHRFYFLGKPQQFEGQPVKYWMNGTKTAMTHNYQPFGWYTLEDLKNETFVEDSRRESLRKKLIFNSKGEYRKDHIYDESGNYDYVAMAKREGVPDDIAYHKGRV